MASDSGLAAAWPATGMRASPVAILHGNALGVRFTIRCNHPDLLTAIEHHCRAWQAPDPDPHARAIDMTITVDGASDARGALTVRATRDHFDLTGDGVHARADAVLGKATCRLSEGWAQSPRTIEEVVEPLLLFLVSRSDRTPIHAAACVIDGTAMILAGPSGTGKSCLAYAAQDAGWPVLSDDTVHVQLRPGLGLWGLPQPIHIFPDDAPPAAAGMLRWRNGKLKRAIGQDAKRAIVVHRAVLCLIERGDAVALDIVRAAPNPDLLPALEPGFDLRAPESRAACAALSARGFTRLTLSRDPAETIAALYRHRHALAEIAAG